MSKQYTIFIVLFLIPAASGLQTQELDSYTVNKDIRSFNPTEKSDFQLQLNTRNSIYLFNKTGKQQEIHRNGKAGWTIDTTLINDTRYWISGFRFPGSYIVFTKDGVKIEESYPRAIDWAEFVNRDIFLSRSQKGSELTNINGESFWFKNLNQGRELVTDIHRKQDRFILSAKNGDLFVADKSGVILEINTRTSSRIKGKYISSNKILAFWNSGLSLHDSEDGEELWRADENVDSEVVVFEDKMVYSSEGEMVIRDLEGEEVKRRETGFDSPYVFKMPDREWIGVEEDGKIKFFDQRGTEVGKVEIDNFRKRPRVAEYDGTKGKELAAVSGQEVNILDIKREVDPENYSVKDTVFIGTGKEMLKPVSMNVTVFVSDSSEGAGEIGNETLGIGEVEGVKSIKNFDKIREKEKKYYADTRKKRVYIAALAAKNNASITFDRSEADKDFSDRSLHEIQGLFINEFAPHHIVLADLETEKGLLAAHIAVKQGAIPVHIDDDDNAVIIKQRIEEAFDRIGENRKTVFEGKYVSMLSGATREVDDPVEDGLITDPEDGDSFRTDTVYGDLDDDSLIEAGVGRYPTDTSTASLMFHRSRERKIGEEATVASEYMNSNWPVILATGGGGLRYGSRVESVFREEGYETTHLVEQRSEPVEFLVSLTPVELDSFLGEVEDTEDMLKKYVKDSTANMAGNAMVFIKALNYVEQIMEMYYEFQWSTYEINIDRGLDRMEELEVDLDSDKEGALQKSVMKVLYAFVWPDRHPEINQSSLIERMEKSDIVYYQGVGDEERWVMPNNDSSIVKDRYSGEKTFQPSDVPEMERSIVWDNSDLSGTKNAEMREEFLEKGASSFIGYSTVNYPAYSSISGYNFFLRGKTIGNSLKAAVNQLKMSGFIYSTSAKSGLREKMTRSIRMYGNPEMEKDPIESSDFRTERSCEGNICTLNVSVEPPQKVVEEKGQKFLVSNASSYVLEPGAPITPLYSFSERLPGAELLEVDRDIVSRNVENLTLETYQPLRPGERLRNYSSSDSVAELSDVSQAGDRIIYSIAGVKKSDEVHELVDRAKVSIRYRAPVVLDFSSKNRTLKASIDSEKEFDGELLYRIDNRTESKKLDIEEGGNVFELENVSYGVHEIEGYVVDEDIVAHRSENIRAGKDLEVYVFSPEIEEGSSRDVTAVVSNPNNFTVNKTFRLETGGKVVPGMLEERGREVSIKGGEDVRLSWRVFGTEKGNSSIEVGRSSTSVRIASSGDSETFLGTGRFLQILSSPTSEIRSSVEDGARELVWESEKGVLEIKESSERREVVLKTANFKVRKATTSELELERLENQEGFMERKTENGVRTVSGDLNKSLLERKVALLEFESGKLEKSFSLRD